MGCFHSCFGFWQPQTAASGRNCLCGNAAGLLRAALWLRRGPFPSGSPSSCPRGRAARGRLGGLRGGLHGEKLAESVRRSANPPERRRQPFPRPLLNSALSSPRLRWLRRALLFACSAEDIAMRTGSLFRGERRHEAGEQGCKDTGGTELAAPTCPCSGSLSPPQLAAEPRFAPARAARRRPPAVRRLPSLPARPFQRPRGAPGATLPCSRAFGVPPLWGNGAAAGGFWRSSLCSAQMRLLPPLPGHARKNYSRPGICSGRAELKSLSWAWQPSQRSRQLFQGQPWRVQSSRLTLQEAEEPCSAGTGPAPLSSCQAVGWWGRGGDTGGSAGLGDAATQHLTLLGLR